MASLTDRPPIHNQTSCLSDQADVTGRLGRSRRQNLFYRQKKSRSDFFWRRPLRVTARLDVSTVALTSQPSPLPTRQKKNTPKTNRGATFFLASSTTRHSSLGRIDRIFLPRIFFSYFFFVNFFVICFH